MLVGVPKEIKTHEYRVGLTTGSVSELVHHGHVVIVETMFRYQGFGYTLVEGAGNNDIDLLLGCSLVSVFVVLFTQLISDIGYAYLNPRIRVQ